MSSSKIIGQSSASKRCVVYFGLPAAAGMSGSGVVTQMSLRQQFRLTCDAAVHKAFFEAKQRYGAPRLADEMPEFNIKTIAASLRRQGLRAKVQPGQLPCTWPARIGESAGAGLQRPEARTRSGR